jgi:DNA modification methylase
MALLIHGDAEHALGLMPSESIDQFATSPPYWQQRDYAVDGQIGRERTVGEYLDRLFPVADAAKRILRPEGTLFVNVGDKYVGKRRMLIPERFAIGMDPAELHRLAQAQPEAGKTQHIGCGEERTVSERLRLLGGCCSLVVIPGRLPRYRKR